MKCKSITIKQGCKITKDKVNYVLTVTAVPFMNGNEFMISVMPRFRSDGVKRFHFPKSGGMQYIICC